MEVSDGIMEIGVEEPRIGDVEIRFIDRKTGEPTAGATRREMITRHLKNVKPGKALHGRMLDDLNDLISTAGLENANITWNPRRGGFKPGSFLVDCTINVPEKQTAGFSGGGGISAKGLQEGGLSALIANADYFRRNLFGRCQTLTTRVEISPSNFSSKPEIDVKLQLSDPWIGDASHLRPRSSIPIPPPSRRFTPGRTREDEDEVDINRGGRTPGIFAARHERGGVSPPAAACGQAPSLPRISAPPTTTSSACLVDATVARSPSPAPATTPWSTA